MANQIEEPSADLDLRFSKNKPYSEDVVTQRSLILGEMIGLTSDQLAKIQEDRFTLFKIDEEKVEALLRILEKIGFTNPTKLIEDFPNIMGSKIDSVRGKIDNLKDLGFANPVKLIEILPSILSYNVESVRDKINNLRDLGFANPVKLIEGFPSIIGSKTIKESP